MSMESRSPTNNIPIIPFFWTKSPLQIYQNSQNLQQIDTSSFVSTLAHPMHLNDSRRWCLYRIGKMDTGMTHRHLHTFHHRLAWWWHERAHEPRDSFLTGDLVMPPYLLRIFIIGCRKDFGRYSAWSTICFKAYGSNVFLPFRSYDDDIRTILLPCFSLLRVAIKFASPHLIFSQYPPDFTHHPHE